LLLEEAAITFYQLTSDKTVSYFIVDIFQYYWQKANERIALSFSVLHMGHYKAVRCDRDLPALHAAKLTLAAKAGLPLDRWGEGEKGSLCYLKNL